VTDVVIIDTNVPVVAAGTGDVSSDCYEACRAAVLDILEDRRRLAIDDGWRIITEYRRVLSTPGQPNLGGIFLKWVLTHQATSRVERVAITERVDETDFEEFPNNQGLESFDHSDRKFVAVANAHLEKPPILQGLDSKWWGWQEALALAGITVQFLCLAQVKGTYESKFKEHKTIDRQSRRG
jgi:hypothetical protein